MSAEPQDENAFWDNAQTYSVGAPGVPSGLSNVSAGQTPPDDGGAQFLSQAKQWYTGASTESQDNGWNTEFFDKMFTGRQEAAEAGTLRTYFADGGTGIVTYNHEENGQDYRFGDIYEDGRNVGNLFDEYGDDAAYAMMADLTLDATTKARAFEYGTTSREVEQKREETEQNLENSLAQLEYNADVQRTQGEITEGNWDEAIVGIVGAAGGAALAGAAAGSIVPGIGTAAGALIGLGGGIIGGVGALLNKDQITEQAAGAIVRTEMAYDDLNPVAGTFTAAQGVGELALAAGLSPLTNVVQGSYDALEGTWGDNESAYYAVDPATGTQLRPGWMTAVSTVASLGDAVLMGGSRVGMELYGATMWTSVIGRSGTMLTSGGFDFDYTRGGFNNIAVDDQGNFDPVSLAAGIGSVGIDAVQAALPSALKYIGRGAGTFNPAGGLVSRMNPLSLESRAARAGLTVERQGATYFLRDKAGAITKQGYTIGIAAPSEMVSAMNIRYAASRALMKRRDSITKGVITPDDMYRASMAMQQGTVPFRLALVNGFGEGAEEFSQGLLDAVAHDTKMPSGRELWTGMVQGFVLGAGMSLGSTIGMRSQNAQQLSQMNTLLEARGMPAIDMDRLTQMNTEAPGLAENLIRQMQMVDGQAAQHAAKAIMDDAQATVLATTPEWEWAAREQEAIREVASATAAPRTGASYKIAQLPAGRRPDSVELSMQSVVRESAKIAKGLEMQIDLAKREGDSATQAFLEAALEFSVEITTTLDGMAAEVQAAVDANDVDLLRNRVAQVNEYLREAYSDSANIPRARAATILVSRFPHQQSGSYLALLPQVNVTLTQDAVNGGALLHPAVLKSIDGDFDGDTVRSEGALLMDEAHFRQYRAGESYIGAKGVRIGSHDDMGALIKLMGNMTQGEGGAPIQRMTEHHIKWIVTQVRVRINRHAPTINADTLETTLDSLADGLRAGNDEIVQEVLSTMLARYKKELIKAGRRNLNNPFLEISDTVYNGVQRWRKVRSRLKARPDLEPYKSTDNIVNVDTSSRYHSASAMMAATEGMTAAITEQGSQIIRIMSKLKLAYEGETDAAKAEIDPLLTQLQTLMRTISRKEVLTPAEKIGTKDRIQSRAMSILRTMIPVDDSSLAPMQHLMKWGAAYVQNIDPETGYVHKNAEGVTRMTMAQWALRISVEIDRRENAVEASVNPKLEQRWSSILRDMTHDNQHGAAFVELFGGVREEDLLPGSAALIAGGGGVDGANGNPMTVAGRAQWLMAKDRNQRTEWRSRNRETDGVLYWGSNEDHQSGGPWEPTDIAQITPLRAYTEMMLNYANHEIYLDEKGVAQGRKAEAARLAQKNLEGGLASMLEGTKDSRKILGIKLKTSEDAASFLQANPSMARTYLDMLSAYGKAAAGAISIQEREGRTYVYVAPFIRNALLEEDSKKAAWIFMKGAIKAEINAMVAASTTDDRAFEYASIESRIMQVVYRQAAKRDQDPRALEYFLERLDQANSPQEFEADLNNHFRQDSEPPFLVFMDEVSAFEPGIDTGFLGASPEVAMSTAITEFQTEAKRLQSDLAEMADDYSADTQVISALSTRMDELESMLEPVLDSSGNQKRNEFGELDWTLKPKYQLDTAGILYKNLMDAIDRARTAFPPMGYNMMMRAVYGGVSGVNADSAEKAIAAEHVAALGRYRMALNGRFGTQASKAASATTAALIDVYITNPQLMLRGGRAMTEDGTPVTVPPLTAKFAVEMMRDNPKATSVLKSVLSFNVFEAGDGDITLRQQLNGSSLQEILSQNLYLDSYTKSPRGRQTYSMLFSGLYEKLAMDRSETDPAAAESAGLIQQVAEVAISHAASAGHTLTPSEQREISDNAFRMVIDLLMDIGAFKENNPGAKLSNIRELMRAIVDEDSKAKVFDIFPDFKEYIRARGATGEALDEANANDAAAVIQEEMKDLTKLAEAGDADAQSQLADKLVELNKVLGNEGVMVASLKRVAGRSGSFGKLISDHGEAIHTAALKAELAKPNPDQTVVAQQRALQNATRLAVQRYVLDPNTSRRAKKVTTAIPLIDRVNATNLTVADSKVMQLTDKEWAQLSAAVIGGQVAYESNAALSGVDVPPLPAEYERGFNPDGSFPGRHGAQTFDRSMLWLVDRLLDDGGLLVETAQLMYRRSKLGADRNITRDDILKSISNTIFNPENLSGWDPSIPVMVNGLRTQILSSAAEPGIQAFGSYPAEYAAIAAATEWTYETVDKKKDLSTMELGLAFDPATNTFVLPKPETELPYIMRRNGVERQRTTSPLILEGRLINAFRISFETVDGTNSETDLDITQLLNISRIPSATMFRDQQMRVSTLSEIQLALNEYLADMQLKPESVKLSVDFAHLHSAPLKARNSLSFNGVSDPLGATMPTSTIGGAIFSPDAESHEGQNYIMNALKKVLEAYPQKPLPSAETIASLQNKGIENLDEIIYEHAKLLTLHDTGAGVGLPTYINRWMKELTMQYKVRGVDSKGLVQVWDAEAVIDWFFKNSEATVADFPLRDASIEVLPLPAVATLLGEVGSAGVVDPVTTQPTYERYRVHRYTGHTRAHYERTLPGILTSSEVDGRVVPATENLADALAQYRVRHTPHRGRRGIDETADMPYTLAKIEKFRELSEPMLQTRQKNTNFKEDRESDLKDITVFLSSIRKNARHSIGLSNLLDPSLPSQIRTDNDLLPQILEFIGVEKALKLGRYNLAHIHREFSSESGVNVPVLTGASIDDGTASGAKPGRGAAFGDLVIVDVDSFHNGLLNEDEKLARVIKRVDFYMSRGVKLGLSQQSSGEIIDQVRQHIINSGYTQVESGSSLFIPRTTAARSQNLRAYDSLATRTRAWQPGRAAIVAESIEFPAIEHSSILLDPEWRPEGASHEVRIPVELAYGTQLVSDPDIAAQVKAKVMQIRNDPELFERLVKSAVGTEGAGFSGKREANEREEFVRREFDAMITRFKEDEASGHFGLTPSQESEMYLGRMMPYYNAQLDVIVFYMVGFDTPSDIKDAEDNTKIRNRVLDQIQQGDPGDVRFAVHYAAPPKNSDHTVFDGTIKRVSSTAINGAWVVEVHDNISQYMKKLIKAGAGVKAMTSPNEDVVSLTAPIAGNRRITFAMNEVDVAGKEGYLNTIFGFEGAYKLVGKDVRPHLIRFFLDQEPAADGDARQSQMELVTKHLTAIGNMHGYDPAAVVAMMRDRSQVFVTKMRESISAFNNDTAGAKLQDFTSKLGQDARYQSVDTTFGFAAIAHMMTHGARATDIMGFAGITAQHQDQWAQTAPPIFSEVLDNAPDAIRAELVEDVNQRMTNDYWMDTNFMFHSIHRARGKEYTFRLSIGEYTAALDSPALIEGATKRAASSQPFSQTSADVAYLSAGMQTAIGKPLVKSKAMQKFLADANYDNDKGVLGTISSAIPTADPTYKPLTISTAAEQQVIRAIDDLLPNLSTPIDTSAWGKDAENPAFEDAIAETMRITGWTADDRPHIERLIRIHTATPRTKNEPEYLTFKAAIGALARINSNMLDDKTLPSAGALIPHMPFDTLRSLNRAYSRGDWTLIDDGQEKKSFDQWQRIAIGQAENDAQEIAHLDNIFFYGLRYTFIRGNASEYGQLGVVPNEEFLAWLKDPKKNRIAITNDGDLQSLIDDPMVTETDLKAFNARLGVSLVNGRFAQPQRGLDYQSDKKRNRKSAEARRGEANRVADSTSNKLEEKGRTYTRSASTLNNALSVFGSLRAAQALSNPALIMGSVPEFGFRVGVDSFTDILYGSSVGRAAEMLEARFPGLMQNSLEDIRAIRASRSAVGHDPRFTTRAFDSMYFLEGAQDGSGRISGAIHGWARWSAKAQELLLRSFSGTRMAEQYMKAVLEFTAATPGETQISAKTLAVMMEEDPKGFAEAYPEADSYAMNQLSNLRSLRATVFSIGTEKMIRGVSSLGAPGALVGTFGLRLPLMFNRFMFNQATTLTGMQGPQAALAMMLHGRRNTRTWLRDKLGQEGAGKYEKEDFRDLSAAVDSVDLTRAVIQSGVTHTGLFLAAMLAQSWNLSGEDDEDRRRRKAAAYQGVGYIYDPRELANDFRNSESIFLDNVPILGPMFYDPETDQAMVNMHWIVKQFIGPVIGIEKFFETGDIRQITWGYIDALGSFPLINESGWALAQATVSELSTIAENAAQGEGMESSAEALNAMTYIMLAYESMLVENTFLNTLYAAGDEWDRDPYVEPQKNETGETVTDRLGNVQDTDALNPFQNDEGSIQSGYVGRNADEAFDYAISENRMGYSIIKMITSGFDTDYWRYNMAIKTRSVTRDELTPEEAEKLVMSVWDSDNNREVLTAAGGQAILRSTLAGIVSLGDPALDGVWLSGDTRGEIEDMWIEELIQEQVDKGVTDINAATSNAYDIYNGVYTPYSPSIRETLWSTAIPYGPTSEYYQMNTTYVTGPDNKPWATGVSRNAVAEALGLPFASFYNAGDTNLEVDGRLNNTDVVDDTNLGQRGLVKVDDSWAIPSAEELNDRMIKAFEDALQKDYTPSGYNYGGYGYGGGGGGGYSSRLYAPQDNDVAYSNTAPRINTGSPYVRRASIRRERYSNQRGRLKPWQ